MERIFGSNMKTLYLLISLAIIGFTSAQYCYKDIQNDCLGITANEESLNCNANYSGVNKIIPDLQEYVVHHLNHSFQYLLISVNFGIYEKNREGFAKLFRKLSDSTWEDAIDTIKYISKRGGSMEFKSEATEEANKAFVKNYSMFELESLSRALDLYKSLAEKAHEIHSKVSLRGHEFHDAETISFLESKFVHKHAEKIRELAGHTSDLKNIVKAGDDLSLSVFLFDEYLQKHFN